MDMGVLALRDEAQLDREHARPLHKQAHPRPLSRTRLRSSTDAREKRMNFPKKSRPFAEINGRSACCVAAPHRHDVGSELIVEWRALTVSLLDLVAESTAKALGEPVGSKSVALRQFKSPSRLFSPKRCARKSYEKSSPQKSEVLPET